MANKSWVFFVSIVIAFSVIGEEDDEGVELDTGYFEEIIESAIDAFDFTEDEILKMREEAVRLLEEAESDPNARFVRNLQAVEEVAPVLSGISSTWEVKESTELFSDLTGALAEYYGSSVPDTELLGSFTTQFITVASVNHQEILHFQLDSFSRRLASHVRFMRDNFNSDVKEKTALWQTIREEMKSADANFDVSSVDEYLDCLDSLANESKTHTLNVFSSLSSSLELTTSTIKKMASTEVDFSREINDYISSVFDPPKRLLDQIEIRFLSPKSCDEESIYEYVEDQRVEKGDQN